MPSLADLSKFSWSSGFLLHLRHHNVSSVFCYALELSQAAE